MLHTDAQTAQRQKALERANDIRTYRRILKEDMAAGRRTFADVLLEGDDRIASMAAIDLLTAVPAIGPEKALKWFRRPPVFISPTVTIKQLTARQEDWLMMLVEEHQRVSSLYKRRRRVALEQEVAA